MSSFPAPLSLVGDPSLPHPGLRCGHCSSHPERGPPQRSRDAGVCRGACCEPAPHSSPGSGGFQPRHLSCIQRGHQKMSAVFFSMAPVSVLMFTKYTENFLASFIVFLSFFCPAFYRPPRLGVTTPHPSFHCSKTSSLLCWVRVGVPGAVWGAGHGSGLTLH